VEKAYPYILHNILTHITRKKSELHTEFYNQTTLKWISSKRNTAWCSSILRKDQSTW